ncbi:MAG: V-type ATP synthase subunit F [Synergistaceae bacterium]|jgi:V/A-type H+-transporting ATPase subunit F|nr:V-type ATP synthase subunit F [Synergistaceae bacterium]
MKAYLISDNHDTLVGMKLAGIDGVVVHGYGEASVAMEQVLERTDVAILAVTEKIAELLPEAMQRLREQGELPVVVEIPDRHGTKRNPDFLTKYVRDAIGVKME